MFARLDRFRKPPWFKPLEIEFCRKCDYISIPFLQLQHQFYPRFRDKIRVIPQGFNFNEIRLFDGEVANVKPVFIFAGTVIPGKRDLNNFIGYISGLSIDFHFIIYSNQTNYFDRYKEMLGDKIEIRDYIDRLSLIYEMSKADFLVNVDTVYDTMNNIEAIPSKLIDYALSGRPILNISSAEPDHANIKMFMEGNYSGRRHIDIDNYDIRSVVDKFLMLYLEKGNN